MKKNLLIEDIEYFFKESVINTDGEGKLQKTELSYKLADDFDIL